jgi:cytochrome b6-f complex iron-sulfur subunit
MEYSRRIFIRQMGALTASVCGLGLAGCASKFLVAGEDSGKLIRIRRSDAEGKSGLIVKSSLLEAPVFLSRAEEGFTAVLMLCTHKSCGLSYTGRILSCPCHGSEFGLDGKVLAPPADTDLRKFKTSLTEEFIIIHTDQPA